MHALFPENCLFDCFGSAGFHISAMGKVSGCRSQKMSSGARERVSAAGDVACIDAQILLGTVVFTVQCLENSN